MTTESRPQTFWTWWICGLLLCASTINYMDRQTLSTVAVRITDEFKINDSQYGALEMVFGLAFAAGAMVFGTIADRINIRWLYPIVLLLWSLMGFLTGFVETYFALLMCRMFLGLFEAGHWPCGLITTHRLLSPENRTLGNSVLQGGTAIGACITPLIMRYFLTNEDGNPTTVPGSWRPAFQIIAAVGSIWAVLWICSTRSKDLAPRPREETAPGEPDPQKQSETFFSAIFTWKFLALVVTVICINACWQLFRAWMPKFLQTGRGYREDSMLSFMFFYHLATEAGCLSAGMMTRLLFQSGVSVHRSRMIAFGICAVLVATGGLIPWLPAGDRLFAVLMMVAFGSLGLFPCYYSFAQEVSSQHLGKVSGLLGTIAWVTTSPLQMVFGRYIDQTKSFDLGMALCCGLPLVAWLVLFAIWPAPRPATE